MGIRDRVGKRPSQVEDEVHAEEFLWDESWIVANIPNWEFIEESLNDAGVRVNDQENIFYEA